MAKYNGREVHVISHIPVTYKVQIKTDAGEQTVPLADVTLNNKEIQDFFSLMQKSWEEQKTKQDTQLGKDTKHTPPNRTSQTKKVRL